MDETDQGAEMFQSKIFKALGPALVTGIAALMIDRPSWYVGGPLLIAAVIFCVAAYWDDLVDQVPILRRFKPAPMPFAELVQHVALRSRWAPTTLVRSTDFQNTWKGMLKAEICQRLVDGRVGAAGVRHEMLDSVHAPVAENAASAISQDFWRSAEFLPELLLSYNPYPDAESQGRDPNLAHRYMANAREFYTGITFDRRSVMREWPTRGKAAIRRHPSPFSQFTDFQDHDADSALFALWFLLYANART